MILLMLMKFFIHVKCSTYMIAVGFLCLSPPPARLSTPSSSLPRPGKYYATLVS